MLSELQLLFADVTGEPDLWQVFDTSIVNESNAERVSGQLCEFAKDKTSIVSVVEPGTEALKTSESVLAFTHGATECELV